MRIPEGVSFEAAASVGVGIGTTGYALYKVLGLPFPSAEQDNNASDRERVVLIYGGSTATGTVTTQFARL